MHIKECRQAVFRLLVETGLAKAFEIAIPYTTYMTFGLTIIIIVCISHKKQRKLPIVCRLAGLSWDVNDFCRGWSITGKTGSGKTESAIKQMMFQVFKNYPRWGGLAIDQKGDFYVLMEGFVNRLKIKNKLIVLKTRPEGTPENWTAPAKYNILSYPGIPATTYASVIVDTGDSVSGGKGEDGAFWKIQSVTNIAAAIELLQTIEEINKTSHIKECIELIPFNNSFRPKGSDEETLYRSDYKEYPKHLSLKNCYTLFNGKNTLKRTMEMYKFIAN